MKVMKAIKAKKALKANEAVMPMKAIKAMMPVRANKAMKALKVNEAVKVIKAIKAIEHQDPAFSVLLAPAPQALERTLHSGHQLPPVLRHSQGFRDHACFQQLLRSGIDQSSQEGPKGIGIIGAA